MSGGAPLKIQVKTKRHQDAKVLLTKVLDEKFILVNVLIVDSNHSVCDSGINFTKWVSNSIISNTIFILLNYKLPFNLFH